MNALESSYTSDGLELTQPQPATKRQRSQMARIQHRFTSPIHKMGEKPLLRCWCGATVPMNSPEVARFAREHGECAMREGEQ